jgi:HK97 family phage prohead protease
MIRRRTVPTRVRSIGDDEIEVIVSTDNLIEQDGLILMPQGCQLANFRANPVILWAHSQDQPIGRAVEIGVKGNALVARIKFAPAGVSQKADEVRGLVKASVISAASIGFDFDPTDARPINPNNPSAGKRVNKWTLLECSMVSIPADPSALVTARAAGRRVMTADESAAISGAAQSVDECLNRHDDLVSALARGDDDMVDTAVRRLGQSLRRAQKLHASLADAAAQADLDASKTVQSSSGVGIDQGSSPAKQPQHSMADSWRSPAHHVAAVRERDEQFAANQVAAFYGTVTPRDDDHDYRRQAEKRRRIHNADR